MTKIIYSPQSFSAIITRHLDFFDYFQFPNGGAPGIYYAALYYSFVKNASSMRLELSLAAAIV